MNTESTAKLTEAERSAAETMNEILALDSAINLIKIMWGEETPLQIGGLQKKWELLNRVGFREEQSKLGRETNNLLKKEYAGKWRKMKQRFTRGRRAIKPSLYEVEIEIDKEVKKEGGWEKISKENRIKRVGIKIISKESLDTQTWKLFCFANDLRKEAPTASLAIYKWVMQRQWRWMHYHEKKDNLRNLGDAVINCTNEMVIPIMEEMEKMEMEGERLVSLTREITSFAREAGRVKIEWGSITAVEIAEEIKETLKIIRERNHQKTGD